MTTRPWYLDARASASEVLRQRSRHVPNTTKSPSADRIGTLIDWTRLVDGLTSDVHPTSILFLTLDSCRFDTFFAAAAPNLKAIGHLYQAASPGNFTYSSHAAMFMGFTPGVASLTLPFVNPKFAKIFKIVGAGFPGKGPEFALLEGHSVIDGMNRLGYATVGTGAVGWFNPVTPTGRVLTRDFDHFFFPEDSAASLPQQLAFAERALDLCAGQPVFLFVNIGETHVPYYFDGALWDRGHNPCVPFAADNDADECRRRQVACVEYVDTQLAPLLERFTGANVVACADHGDAWGEDGLWEHGISHEKVLEVPLLIRLVNPPEASSATRFRLREDIV